MAVAAVQAWATARLLDQGIGAARKSALGHISQSIRKRPWSRGVGPENNEAAVFIRGAWAWKIPRGGYLSFRNKGTGSNSTTLRLFLGPGRGHLASWK
jgi:hypothetical protein